MKEYYGHIQQTFLENTIDEHVEEIKNLGYTVLENHFTEELMNQLRIKILSIYDQQEKTLGKDLIKRINDEFIARAPLLYDNDFFKTIEDETINKIIEKLLGKKYTLMLQNGIINHSNIKHYQQKWHRDLHYQNFIISQPLAINCMVCIDEFTIENGATQAIPYTHKMDILPSG